MSFSQKVKKELAQQISPARHCILSEISAIIFSAGKLIVRNNRYYLVLTTENIEVARKYFTLVKKTYNININLTVRSNSNSKRKHIYSIIIEDNNTVINILKSTKFLEQDSIDMDLIVPNKLIVQKNCCKRAFIRGAFLTSGSISDPMKTYHLEMVFVNSKKAEYIQEVLLAFKIDARIIQRKKYFVLYIKDGTQIVDMLNILEAHVALMELENIRILKEMRNTINRQVNCETANIGKTVVAASKQISDIKFIEEKLGLASLPEELEEIARLRLRYESASLKEIGEMLTNKLSKSGVNHRFRKLGEIAEQLRDA